MHNNKKINPFFSQKITPTPTPTHPPTSLFLCPSRLGEIDDISGVTSFLCSDDARYITGETIVAAGGLQSRL